MNIEITGYNFEGPFKSTTNFKDQSGVYVILCKNAGNNEYEVIDVGESGQIKTRVEDHGRENCWKERCLNLEFAAYYITGENARRNVEKEIRQEYTPPCGER